MKDLNSVLNYLLFLSLAFVAGAFLYLNRDTISAQFGDVGTRKAPVPQAVVDKVVNKYLKQATLENIQQQVLTQKTLAETQKELRDAEKKKRDLEFKKFEEIPLDRQVWKDPSNQPGYVPDQNTNYNPPPQNTGYDNSNSTYSQQPDQVGNSNGAVDDSSSTGDVNSYDQNSLAPPSHSSNPSQEHRDEDQYDPRQSD